MNQEDLNLYRHHLVWITNQFITIFFENTDLSSKYENIMTTKPFIVLFYLSNNHDESRMKFLVKIHEYLAK